MKTVGVVDVVPPEFRHLMEQPMPDSLTTEGGLSIRELAIPLDLPHEQDSSRRYVPSPDQAPTPGLSLEAYANLARTVAHLGGLTVCNAGARIEASYWQADARDMVFQMHRDRPKSSEFRRLITSSILGTRYRIDGIQRDCDPYDILAIDGTTLHGPQPTASTEIRTRLQITLEPPKRTNR